MMTMGVGDGAGQLFVHGDYDSIKAAQRIVLERDATYALLRSALPWLERLTGTEALRARIVELLGD